VQDIAHVINYDLPEVAENFIHRVGRTGRAGEHGVASTLFTRDQRSDLFQLERTLGTRMERLTLTGGSAKLERPERNEPTRDRIASLPPAQRAKMVLLPGEVLQAQMEG
jgi:superfamily II DNA/RNA helicase